jgi:hypothetical protein
MPRALQAYSLREGLNQHSGKGSLHVERLSPHTSARAAGTMAMKDAAAANANVQLLRMIHLLPWIPSAPSRGAHCDGVQRIKFAPQRLSHSKQFSANAGRSGDHGR